MRLDYNLYVLAGNGSPIKFPGDVTWEQWQKDRGQDQHSLIADPLFENPQQGDFRLKPNSPALKLGFVPFDYTRAGRTSPAVLTRDLPSIPAGFR